MRGQRNGKHSRAGEKVKLEIVAADEQTRRIQQAISRRAYAIFEHRGSASWHELEDWRQAESELISRLCCGRMTVGDNFWVGTDAGMFEEGTVEMWIAPRHLTLCGKPRVGKEDGHQKYAGAHPGGEMIFRVLELPVEIDPSHVTASFHGSSLEILFRHANLKQEARGAAA
jgi:hypothetical protein